MFALSPDGTVLITRRSDSATQRLTGVALWDITDPRHPRLRGTIDNLTVTRITLDGHLLAMADYNGVSLWNASNPNYPQLVDPFLQPNGTPATLSPSLSFVPHTNLLEVTAQDGTVQLWNLTDPLHSTITGVLATRPNVDSAYSTFVASPDGHLLATNGANQTVLVWQVTDPTHPVLLDVLSDAANPITFSPDGHTLAVIDTNGTVRLRETDLRHAATQICALTGTTLDPAAWNRYFPGLTYQPPC